VPGGRSEPAPRIRAPAGGASPTVAACGGPGHSGKLCPVGSLTRRRNDGAGLGRLLADRENPNSSGNTLPLVQSVPKRRPAKAPPGRTWSVAMIVL
jgi:hypothetical protein